MSWVSSGYLQQFLPTFSNSEQHGISCRLMEAQHLLHQGSDPQTASVTFHDCPFSNIMEDKLSAAKLQHVKVVFRDASCALPISTKSPLTSNSFKFNESSHPWVGICRTSVGFPPKSACRRQGTSRYIKEGTPQNSVNTSPNIQCKHTGVKTMLTLALWQMH
jgi:hypothetical protein